MEFAPQSTDVAAWYEVWFDQDAYELVYQERDEEEAERVVDLLERVVHPAPGAAILDVGCGRGRHARSLSRRGYRVTGVDLSRRAVARAREHALAEGLDVAFRQGDMREPVAENAFDGVVNLFTAFGYFDEDADHLRAVRAMATALRPGGWVFQDFLNAPQVAERLVPEDRQERDGHLIVQRRWIEAGRINKEIEIRRNGSRETFLESVRLLTFDDFRRLYRAAGLELVRVMGDYDGRPYDEESPRLLLYARKR